jgi:hypothetical protein
MPSPEDCEAHAEECEALVEAVANPETVEIMRSLAMRWRALADRSRQGARLSPSP